MEPDEKPTLEAQLGRLVMEAMDYANEHDITEVDCAGLVLLGRQSDGTYGAMTRTSGEAFVQNVDMWAHAMRLEVETFAAVCGQRLQERRLRIEELEAELGGDE
jgi:hypothetical protein